MLKKISKSFALDDKHEIKKKKPVTFHYLPDGKVYFLFFYFFDDDYCLRGFFRVDINYKISCLLYTLCYVSKSVKYRSVWFLQMLLNRLSPTLPIDQLLERSHRMNPSSNFYPLGLP